MTKKFIIAQFDNGTVLTLSKDGYDVINLSKWNSQTIKFDSEADAEKMITEKKLTNVIILPMYV